jgi:regulatory protein
VKIITGLSGSQGHSKSISLFLDDKFAFKLEAEIVLKEGLQVGQELSLEQIEALKKNNQYQKCRDTALKYLDYRPRSEYEMNQRLIKRGFTDNDIKAVLDSLKKQGFLDDSSFARFWKDNRQSFNPRSRRLTEIELRQKGVSREIIEQEVSTIDDSENAYRAAASRARNLIAADYQGFRRRLGEYLKRRGFGYNVINTTIMRLWQEREGSRIDD